MSTQWDHRSDHLLLQDLFNLLLQDYGLILLSGPSELPWTNRTPRQDALQQESEYYILLEDSGRVALNDSGDGPGFVG